MEAKSKKIVLPPTGYVQELARLAGCSMRTVNAALKHGGRGIKAERVRQLYRAKYGNGNDL
jgi:hypothetical protein